MSKEVQVKKGQMGESVFLPPFTCRSCDWSLSLRSAVEGAWQCLLILSAPLQMAAARLASSFCLAPRGRAWRADPLQALSLEPTMLSSHVKKPRPVVRAGR